MPFQYQPGNLSGSKADNSQGLNLLLSMLMSPGANKTGMPAQMKPVDPGFATGENIGEITAGPNFNYVPSQVNGRGMNGY